MKLSFERGHYEEDRRGWIIALCGRCFVPWRCQFQFTYKTVPGSVTRFIQRTRTKEIHKL